MATLREKPTILIVDDTAADLSLLSDVLKSDYRIKAAVNGEKALKNLATLRTDAKLFRNVAELRWQGPTSAFARWTERMETPRLLERSLQAQRVLHVNRTRVAS